MLRYLTAGESHGQALVAIVEGMPAGLPLEAEYINRQLARRQQGYGRGTRMKIEKDQVKIMGGVRRGYTLGSPIALLIVNRDYPNWLEIMDPAPGIVPEEAVVTRPRPGHADLSGVLKYGRRDVRDILERASARETAARVAAGAVARRFLEEMGIEIFSHVLAIGEVRAQPPSDYALIRERVEDSPLRCADPEAEKEMMAFIDRMKEAGESVGGVFEVVVTGMPVGLGSHVHWDRRLDGRLAGAVMSIPAIKGVEIGLGFAAASMPGSRVHDEIFYDNERGFYRLTNNAGGIEGGISNGQPVVVRGAMKPIPTLYRPLHSVDIRDGKPQMASVERSDTCAVPAAAVVAEAVVAFEIAAAFLEKFGGDSMAEVGRNYRSYLETLREEWPEKK